MTYAVHKYFGNERGRVYQRTEILTLHRDEQTDLEALLAAWPGVADWRDPEPMDTVLRRCRDGSQADTVVDFRPPEAE